MLSLPTQCPTFDSSMLSMLELLSQVLAPEELDASLLTCLAQFLRVYDLRLLRQASIGELQDAGLPLALAERLLSVCELARRLALAEASARPQIKNAADAVALLQPLLGNLPYEVFWVLVLDNHNQVIESREVYRGTICEIELRCAEVLRPAVVRCGASILVAHNHPSPNSPEPSAEDIAQTERLVQAAEIMDIPLVDHLILSGAAWTSLRHLLRW